MSNNKLKVAFIASETAPFAKVGGLADVVGSLPIVLQKLGVDAKVFVPRYQQINLKLLKAKKAGTLTHSFGGKQYKVTIYSALIPNTIVPVYLLDEPILLSRGPIYGRGAKWRDKLTRRFFFFDSVTFPVLQKLGFKPDVIHAHDWPTAPACIMLQQGLGGDYFRGVKSLLTLHNIHNQNRATKDLLTEANINPGRFNKLAMETTWGKTEYNMLGQSIVCSDGVNTVSPRYAKEIYQRFFSEGLERILKKRKDKVAGILNGIDTVYFDPATDAYIPQKYNAKTLNRKIKNKLALQKSLGLKHGNHALLSGVVTRLVPQKGIELVIDAIKKLAGDKHQFVILGDGDDVYEKQLTQLLKKYESHIAFVDRYDSHLAREIYAGADTFLMPSRYEPCGLTQMIAMRYGTVPIVHDTGGLHDSVKPYPKKESAGFVFTDFSPEKFIAQLEKAQKLFTNKSAWKKLQLQGMKQDFSWKHSAKEYVKLYKKLIK